MPQLLSTFLQISTWWYIHTATLYQLSCTRTRHNIYIPQLYINFSADEHVVIYTCYNFILTFLQINTWWYVHTATLYQLFCRRTPDDNIHTVTLYELSCRWTRDHIYIPQLYINFPADKHVMIYTYCNFISTFLHMNTWWYIHTATLYQFSCR